MRMLIITLLLLPGMLACSQPEEHPIRCGAERMDYYLPFIEELKIALVVNHTSVVGNSHLIDTLISSGLARKQLVKVFAPEHGFRGKADAGEKVESGVDPVTGIPVVSLYGDHKKPVPEDLEGVDLVLFDIQDVGARFYTYISTLHYVMEACAENGVPLMVLDRPNPNSGYVDGPILEPEYRSFVGMHPIPVVYGLTIGELASMINGEGWLHGGVQCNLSVVRCNHYYHGKAYSLPVSPSPNLTRDHAIRLYPSTCFFEGTVVSEGRGTPTPFELYGHPDLEGAYSFTPVSVPGASRYPKLEGQHCSGEDLRSFIPEEGWDRLFLEFLLDAYHKYPHKEEFFIPFFEKLAGTADLRWQIEAGWDESKIRASWRPGLDNYMRKREKYLIYD
ncbi:MAG: DUF1343 domain-containing protein [Bacteroidota bacterium]